MNDSQSYWWIVVAFVISPLLVVWGSSYTPDEFDINDDTVIWQHVWNMSSLDKVEKKRPDAIAMKEDAVAAIMYPGETQFASEFMTSLSGGEGVRFRFRTTRHDYRTNKNKGLCFIYSPTGCSIEEDGKVVQRIDSLRAPLNTPTRILIENQGRNYSITVGCSRIAYTSTALPATEYVIVETLTGTNAALGDITFTGSMEE